MVLSPPQTLRVVRAAADTATVTDVARVRGRLVASTDTLIAVDIRSVKDAGGRAIDVPSGARLLVPAAAQPRFESRDLSLTRTVLTVIGVSMAIFALGIAAGGGGP